MKTTTRPGTRPHGERGQALVLFAAGLAGFLGLVGMAVDIGQAVQARTDLQKVADAAALAGAQDLTNAGAARASAEDWVVQNGSNVADATITITHSGAPNDTIEVTVERKVNYTFLRAVGLNDTTVTASAKVRVAAYSGGNGLLPFGFVASNNSDSTLLQNSCYTGNDANGVPTFKQNVNCTIKFGAGSSAGGDFGALSLDGSGANNYRNSIANGSSNSFKKGDTVNPETGNMSGPTSQGLSQRMAKGAPQGCSGNSRSDVLITNADGSVSIRPGCEDSPRIGIVPVVDKIQDPQNSEILGFAFIFIRSTSTGSGNDSEIDVEFVEFVSELPGGVYDGSGQGAKILKLIE